MASLFVWKGNEATVCRFHRTPSDWDYVPLSSTETLEFVRMLRAEGSPRSRPASRARWATEDGGRAVR
jgi:hypothetical protein